MKVSVIIPSYNRSYVLRRAIDSVMLQNVDDIEIIVVDDQSTDDTKKLIDSFNGKVKYVFNKHQKGPAGARNQGLETVSGEYVAFLDSDDEWYPWHLEDSLRYLENCHLGASYALWHRLRGNTWEKYSDEWLDFLMDDLHLTMYDKAILLGDKIAEYMICKPFWCFHIDTLVMRRDTISKCGFFKEHFSSAEDLDFAFRILLDVPACLIRDYHARYYEGDDNLVALRSADPAKIRAHNLNMIEAFKQIGIIGSSSPLIVDKARFQDGVIREMKKYEILH